MRWGDDQRGKGPWTRQKMVLVGRDEATGFAIWEWRDAETGADYSAMWSRGSDEWHKDNGVSSRILDADGNTVFIFD